MEDYNWLKKHCEAMLVEPQPFEKAEHTEILKLIEHYEHSIAIPENATNGDIIKMLMPITDIWECWNRPSDCNEICVKSKGITDISYFKADWWNAPFKGAKWQEN